MVLSLTCGGQPSFYTPSGIFGDIDVVLWPIKVSSTYMSHTMLRRPVIHEPCCEKTGFLHMRKQRRR